MDYTKDLQLTNIHNKMGEKLRKTKMDYIHEDSSAYYRKSTAMTTHNNPLTPISMSENIDDHMGLIGVEATREMGHQGMTTRS